MVAVRIKIFVGDGVQDIEDQVNEHIRVLEADHDSVAITSFSWSDVLGHIGARVVFTVQDAT